MFRIVSSSDLLINLHILLDMLQVHHWVVLLIFSVTFALSCTMFELIIFEILGILDSRCVAVFWSIDFKVYVMFKICAAGLSLAKLWN